MAKGIFRSKALAKLASPEELDTLMRITSPRGWFALAAFGLLAISVVVWGFAGSIPTKVSGKGILIRTGGVRLISSPSTGRVKNLYFEVGDRIRKGQVVARIDQREIVAEIRQANLELADLTAKYKTLKTRNEVQKKLHDKSIEQKRQNIESSVGEVKKRLNRLKERLTNQSALAKQGYITQKQVLETRLEIDAAKGKIRSLQSELRDLSLQRYKTDSRTGEELTDMESAIREKRGAVRVLRNRLELSSRVISPHAGRIISISAAPGSPVSMGTRLYSVEKTGKDTRNLEAVLFFPAKDGKKIKQGMKIHLSPSTVRPEEYGFMVGLVTYVTDYPATLEGMQNILHNQTLVTTLTEEGGVFEVHAAMIPEFDNTSGYKWTSGEGPQLKPETGTLCNGSVIVEEHRPVSLVIPLLKKIVFGRSEEAPKKP
ncbi:MAG: NHLP bacteriocin system secretion protein [Deltaproteobacteria bacterium]|nr:MAG: NHLP bacteriocin system secretion protein [Deltaproteobacteria bacterium]